VCRRELMTKLTKLHTHRDWMKKSTRVLIPLSSKEKNKINKKTKKIPTTTTYYTDTDREAQAHTHKHRNLETYTQSHQSTHITHTHIPSLLYLFFTGSPPSSSNTTTTTTNPSNKQHKKPHPDKTFSPF